MKIQSIKGMYDLLPNQTKNWRQIENILHNFFSVHGYGEIRTPNIEQTKLFKRVIGDETDIVTKEMYSWEDRNGDNITLRPELTAPTVRAFIEHNLEKLNKNTKLYYIGSAFRRERPQKGRQRQFSQFGVEAIGSEFPEQDAEVISMAYNIYEMLGIENLELVINSVGSNESKAKYSKELKKYLSSYSNKLSDISKKRYQNNPLRILDTKDKDEIKIINGAPSILDFLSKEESEHFNQVKRYLDKLGTPYNVDKGLVRGLDYYTGLVFEIYDKHPDNRRALCGGGAYEGLMSIFGEDQLPGVGFGLGDVTLKDFLEVHKLLPSFNQQAPSVFIASESEGLASSVMKTARFLRKENLSTVHEASKLKYKKIFQSANKMGAKNVVILQLNDSEEVQLKVKNMASGDQKVFSMEELEQCSSFCQ